jgi:hypothetical protein
VTAPDEAATLRAAGAAPPIWSRCRGRFESGPDSHKTLTISSAKFSALEINSNNRLTIRPTFLAFLSLRPGAGKGALIGGLVGAAAGTGGAALTGNREITFAGRNLA